MARLPLETAAGADRQEMKEEGNVDERESAMYSALCEESRAAMSKLVKAMVLDMSI